MIYTLKLSVEQLSVVNAALLELPYRISAPLINEINAQLQKQREEKLGTENEGRK